MLQLGLLVVAISGLVVTVGESLTRGVYRLGNASFARLRSRPVQEAS